MVEIESGMLLFINSGGDVMLQFSHPTANLEDEKIDPLLQRRLEGKDTEVAESTCFHIFLQSMCVCLCVNACSGCICVVSRVRLWIDVHLWCVYVVASMSVVRVGRVCGWCVYAGSLL